MRLPVAILAGGLATRLKPLTDTMPKVLVNVGGRPFAAHQLDLLRSQGFTRVVYCVGHLGEMVESAIGDGSRFGMEIRYVHDGPKLLGTGGALLRALPLLGEDFFVLYGDSYLECDYDAVETAFFRSRKQGMMTILRNADRWDQSNVVYRNGRIEKYDKRLPDPDMRHIDYGLGVLRAEVLQRYPVGDVIDLERIYQDLLAHDQLAAFEVTRRFYEIGSASGLEETRRHLLDREPADGSFARKYLAEVGRVVEGLDVAEIERMVDHLVDLRTRGGRLFFLGVGGSAANCSHAVNDFRKIVGIEAYTPTDNVSELTARTNDEGWAGTYAAWLKGSRLQAKDMVFVFSVGGGNLESNISPNLVEAMRYAKEVGARILGLVGRDGGYAGKVSDACVIVPTVNPENVTPHTESFQAVLCHLLVSHPKLKSRQTKWESVR